MARTPGLRILFLKFPIICFPVKLIRKVMNIVNYFHKPSKPVWPEFKIYIATSSVFDASDIPSWFLWETGKCFWWEKRAWKEMGEMEARYFLGSQGRKKETVVCERPRDQEGSTWFKLSLSEIRKLKKFELSISNPICDH